MPDSDVPIEKLTAAYDNWRATKGRNLDEVLDLFADEIEMSSVLEANAPQHELARTHSSKEDARAYFKELLDNWEMIDFPTERILVDGDTAVWIGRCSWRNKHDGKELDTRKVDIWTFHNGKAVRFFEMFDSLGFARAASLI